MNQASFEERMAQMGFQVDNTIAVEPVLERQLMTAICTQSALLWQGAPGIGKTSTIQAVCAKYGLALEMVLMSLYDYQDIMGWPIKAEHKVKIGDQEYPAILFAPPRWVSTVANASVNRPAVIYLNEINGGTPHQHLMANRIAFERHAGDVNFDPRKVAVVADCNPPELATGGSELTPAMISRFDYYEDGFKPNLEFWIKNYPSYFGVSDKICFGKSELDPIAFAWARQSVAAFLHHAARADMRKFHNVPESEAQRRKPQPSPRTWDFAARKLAFVRQMGWPIEEALPMMISRVGHVAAEAMVWIADQDLRDPEDIIAEEIASFKGDNPETSWKRKNPSPFTLQKRGDKAISLLAAVQLAVMLKMSPSRYVACWRILHAASEQGGRDVASAAAMDFIKESSKIGYNMPLVKDEIEPFVQVLRDLGKLKLKNAEGVMK